MKEILGCWGCGDLSELETLFGKVLSKASVTKGLQQFSYQNNHCVATFAGWNFTNNPSINGKNILKKKHFCQVSLSAAGIYELPDAVIKFENDRLILSRDCFGRVPLYWFCQQQVIWFASRLQLLLLVLDSPQVSIPGFYGYNCFSYVPTPLTSVENIFTVPPGCEIVWQINQNSAIQNIYEWVETENLIRDEKTAISQLQTLLTNSIYRQISNLPDSEEVGVFLSGGLDSSVVAALLVEAGVKVKAYALDFGEYGVRDSSPLISQRCAINSLSVYSL
ncbi:MAG: asparagine synthase-related protein [Nostocales cyanobacterium 94392]|nr:asparagine synthase-related protein [Nostocales cyanobacterium 94392]